MGVFSHDEAFYYYGLTDREPLVHTLTIYSGYNVHRLKAVSYTHLAHPCCAGRAAGHISFRYQHCCLRYAAADGAMRRRDPLLQGRSAGGAIHPEKRGWNADLCLRIRGCGHTGTRRV